MLGNKLRSAWQRGMNPFLWGWPPQDDHSMVSSGASRIQRYYGSCQCSIQGSAGTTKCYPNFFSVISFHCGWLMNLKGGAVQRCSWQALEWLSHGPWAHLCFSWQFVFFFTQAVLVFLLFWEFPVIFQYIFLNMTKYCSSTPFDIGSGMFNFCVLFVYMSLLHRYFSPSLLHSQSETTFLCPNAWSNNKC